MGRAVGAVVLLLALACGAEDASEARPDRQASPPPVTPCGDDGGPCRDAGFEDRCVADTDCPGVCAGARCRDCRNDEDCTSTGTCGYGQTNLMCVNSEDACRALSARAWCSGGACACPFAYVSPYYRCQCTWHR